MTSRIGLGSRGCSLIYKNEGRSRDLAFLSFEWYPFDDLYAARPASAAGPSLLAEALDQLRRQGLPPSIPLLITEYGYSVFAKPKWISQELCSTQTPSDNS